MVASCNGLAQLPVEKAERMRGNQKGTGRRMWRKKLGWKWKENQNALIDGLSQ